MYASFDHLAFSSRAHEDRLQCAHLGFPFQNTFFRIVAIGCSSLRTGLSTEQSFVRGSMVCRASRLTSLTRVLRHACPFLGTLNTERHLLSIRDLYDLVLLASPIAVDHHFFPPLQT